MNAKTYVYVASATDRVIARYRLDKNNESLILLGETPSEQRVMPLVISPDNAYLYASIRSEPFHLVSYKIDHATGDLFPLGNIKIPYSLANIDLDRTGQFLFACSYGDHLITVNAIQQNNTLGEAQQTLATGRHAHAIHASPDNRYVFTTCLGDHQILQYRFDVTTGALTPNQPPSVATPADSGPRHFVFSRCGKYLYVLGETSGSVTTFALDTVTGLLTFVGESAGLPLSDYENTVPYKGRKIWATDIHASADGRFLYLSEVVKNIVCVLSIYPENGQPSYQAYVDVEDHPRGFNITKDGRYMIVAGNNDEKLGLYKLDTETGLPIKISQVPTGKGANWVEVVELP